MKYSADARLRVLSLRKEGYTYDAIVEMTGIAGAYHICRVAGLTGMGHGHLGRKSMHTKEEKQKVLNLREEGYTYVAISEITGMAEHNISHYCGKAGVKPKPRYSKEEKQKVLSLRKEGYVCRAISEITEIDVYDVRFICNEIKKVYGHLGNKKIPNPFAARNKVMRGLRVLGLTLEQIGNVYGITRERVRQLCVGIEPQYVRKSERNVNCCVCGIEYVRVPWRNYSFSKYCSGECRKKGREELMRQKNAKFSRIAMIELTCTGCGVKFERTNRLESIAECGRKTKGRKDSGRRFCSRKCYQKNGHIKRMIVVTPFWEN
jgi:uncharacterized protein YerC